MPQENVLCDQPNIFTPETACHEGCPILSKVRHIVVPKGVCAIIEWQLRKQDGSAVDLSACFPGAENSESSVSVGKDPAEAVKARFADCDGTGSILQIAGIVSDAEAGKIRFAVPQGIYDSAGIYVMSMAILQQVGDVQSPIFIDNGLLSIEGTLWGNTTQGTQPPTLGEIRMHLRDTPIENDLLADVEFDSQEIIGAITRPVRQWNETPPPVAPFTCRTFPFRYHWLQAVVGELLRTSAHHYMRNNLKMNHAGLTGNFKDKFEEYMGVANQYTAEWKDFIIEKKIEINASMGFGSLSSPYDRAYF